MTKDYPENASKRYLEIAKELRDLGEKFRLSSLPFFLRGGNNLRQGIAVIGLHESIADQLRILANLMSHGIDGLYQPVDGIESLDKQKDLN